ncbi:MAG: class I SAM-dependent methyltransferase [Chitinophagales bacterium]|nr:class I SAM-dependent methyltransferase [Chitinophagales bacterium]
MQAFYNRLQKVNKHTSKWARRHNIECYRIYDLDMPEFPLCIDRYKDWVHVSEYKAKHGMEEEEHQQWLQECILVICAVMEVPMEKIVLKERKRQKGKEQYTKIDSTNNEMVVEENGLKFIVNLKDYLDTGLFLDHRNLREIVRKESEGKRVLNLFSYTGSFSVYAAAGGAEQVTTVDMSNTYLSWARKNMLLNGFDDKEKYTFLSEDVKPFLKTLGKNSYDLIILDPPTFSNSKKMKHFLDIQLDHTYIINDCLKLLTNVGKVYFSTNFRNFQLEYNKINTKNIKEITNITIPEDFRNKNIHKTFEIILKKY